MSDDTPEPIHDTRVAEEIRNRERRYRSQIHGGRPKPEREDDGGDKYEPGWWSDLDAALDVANVPASRRLKLLESINARKG